MGSCEAWAINPRSGGTSRHVPALFRALLVGALVCAFWLPASRATSPLFPAPLDDVYIYFDFARSTARGCVLCWSTDTGYSSGATSPLYALVLAIGWGVGFRGAALGWFAAALTALSLFDLTGSVAKLARHRAIAALATGLLVSVPLLDWTLVSGMEVAFVAALVGRALCAVDRACSAAPHFRAAAQLRAGVWIATVAIGRPECVPLAFALAISVGHAARSLSLPRSLARALGPMALALGALALANSFFTGEVAANGAIRKLVSEDPFASSTDAALMMVANAVRLYTLGFEVALGGAWPVAGLLSLAAVSMIAKSTRRLGVSLVFGSFAALALVTVNKTAPFQNLRYVAPTLLMLLVAAGLGVRAAAGTRWGGALAGVTAAFVASSALSELGVQTNHYRRSAKNIAEQQVEVGRRIAEMSPKPRRVFVGDAGAIPYVSDVPGLDGLGLGGYHDLPFARASVHGVGAVVELIERLEPSQRPDVLAIYDGWWPDLGARFGERAFSVKIEDNVICADPEKVVYRADWSLLEDRRALADGALFRLDVADLVDEAAFEVDMTHPRAGYVTFTVLADEAGRETFDAQRIFADGQWLSFVVPELPAARARLVFTTESPAGSTLVVERMGRDSLAARVQDHASGAWGRAELVLDDLRARERVKIVASAGPIRLGSIRGFAP